MKLLLDMNLPKAWCDLFRQRAHEAVHWSDVGDPRASDKTLMEFAEASGSVVVTYDLDFGALLAATRARGPSVILIRAVDITTPAVAALVLAALDASSPDLEAGAIVTIDEAGHRVRALPIGR